MKIPHTRAALRHYDWIRAEEDHCSDPALPANPGKVHSIDLKPHRLYRDRSLDRLAAFHGVAFDDYAWTAECGVRVRVALPMAFDTSDPDTCDRCLRWLELKAADPAEYDRQKRENRIQQAQRFNEEEAVREYQDRLRRESYDEPSPS